MVLEHTFLGGKRLAKPEISPTGNHHRTHGLTAGPFDFTCTNDVATSHAQPFQYCLLPTAAYDEAGSVTPMRREGDGICLF